LILISQRNGCERVRVSMGVYRYVLFKSKLRTYEQEKAKLEAMGLPPKEYERCVKKLGL